MFVSFLNKKNIYILKMRSSGILLHSGKDIQYNKYKQTEGRLEKKETWGRIELHSESNY